MSYYYAQISANDGVSVTGSVSLAGSNYFCWVSLAQVTSEILEEAATGTAGTEDGQVFAEVGYSRSFMGSAGIFIDQTKNQNGDVANHLGSAAVLVDGALVAWHIYAGVNVYAEGTFCLINIQNAV